MPNAESLRASPRLFGLWSVTADPAVIDAACSTRPDFICIDTQHGVAVSSLDASIFTVMASYGVAGLVRVDSVERVSIGRALDLGAVGVIIPQVDTAEEAERAVSATRYMPVGDRSFGMQTRRVGPFDERPYVAIQIETAGALAAASEIAAVDGVDCLYIGPADLGLSLGGSIAEVGAVYEGTASNSKEMKLAFSTVVEACEANGVAPGVHCVGGAPAAKAHAEGFTVSAVAGDVGLIAAGLAAELARARESV
jgi:4-hydroxy-2-oxoheptanedioate aldolase